MKEAFMPLEASSHEGSVQYQRKRSIPKEAFTAKGSVHCERKRSLPKEAFTAKGSVQYQRKRLAHNIQPRKTFDLLILSFFQLIFLAQI